MTKGYWVAHMDIEDVDKYKSYQQANTSPFEKFGAKFLIRGGVQDVREGVSKSRTVVIEFESLETAIACYESLDYQEAKKLRDPISNGDLVIIEGS
ncbi:MAG: DUF1330 domain-containing protein [Rhodobacteraceae bacterium]|jgi:uncharacterized protein (DUF1330 family)|nr:DUF1330 domain-containing protein [Paracoccaceae bacterium]MBT6272268.1 DUF1330 domain-containing protein [Paracoccaceae bacterium]